MDKKSDFIAAAINDTQSTIRAIDLKVATLLVMILAPFAKIDRVFWHLSHLATHLHTLPFLIIVFIFIFTWILSLIALVRSICAIDNPSQHIINSSLYTGRFYAGGLYMLNIMDVFFNLEKTKASMDVQTFVDTIPDNEQAIEKELAFEKMKLAYIRDIKLNRLDWGMRFALIWFAFGIFVFIFSKYYV
ncbi:MAG: hypothetical protein WCG16_10165 [Methylococcales bacterium]